MFLGDFQDYHFQYFITFNEGTEKGQGIREMFCTIKKHFLYKCKIIFQPPFQFHKSSINVNSELSLVQVHFKMGAATLGLFPGVLTLKKQVNGSLI